MAHKRGKRTLIIVLSILAVLLVVVGVVALISAMNPSESDPYKATSTTETINETDTTTEPEPVETTEPEETNTEEVTIDPATVSTIDITPMAITVSYVKGIGGFSFQVYRSADGTRYVEFSTEELAGTKCTDDTGVFASILEDPKDETSGTLDQKVTVDGTLYGLALPSDTCTNDASLLEEYQTSFSDAFPLLKKMN